MRYKIQYVNNEVRPCLKGARKEYNSSDALLILIIIEVTSRAEGRGMTCIGMLDYMCPLIRSRGDR